MKLSEMVIQSNNTSSNDTEEIQTVPKSEEQTSTEEQELAQEIENLKAMAGI